MSYHHITIPQLTNIEVNYYLGVNARECARKAVRFVVGDVNVMSFDSAEDIYKFACEKAGMDLNDIVSYKDAFKGLTAGRSKLALDASPKCGSNEECFKNIRIA